MTVSELKGLIADLPDDMPVAVRGYENGFDALVSEDVRVLPLVPYVNDEWFVPPGSHWWFDGDFVVWKDGVPHLVIGTTAWKPER